MVAQMVPELWGVPAMRHEGACASSSLGILSAMAEIEAGRYDCVLVLGVEEFKNVPGDIASQNQNAAAWQGHEGIDCKFMWPAVFGLLAQEYDRRYGLDRRYLNRIAEINYTNAKRNPLAQTRKWNHDPLAFTDDDEANPVIEPGTRRQDCGQITDGACGVVLHTLTGHILIVMHRESLMFRLVWLRLIVFSLSLWLAASSGQALDIARAATGATAFLMVGCLLLMPRILPQLSAWALLRSLLGTATIAAVMYGAVVLLHMPSIPFRAVRLALDVAVGATVFISLSLAWWTARGKPDGIESKLIELVRGRVRALGATARARGRRRCRRRGRRAPCCQRRRGGARPRGWRARRRGGR